MSPLQSFYKVNSFLHKYLPRPRRGTGYCFQAISFFLSFFVSLSARLRENGWTDFHEIFREGVEWPWDDLIKFWVNSGKPVAPKNPKHRPYGDLDN